MLARPVMRTPHGILADVIVPAEISTEI